MIAKNPICFDGYPHDWIDVTTPADEDGPEEHDIVCSKCGSTYGLDVPKESEYSPMG